MLSAIVIARALLPGEFASYSYFQMTVSMAAIYVGAGLGVTATRYFAEFNKGEVASKIPIGTLWLTSIVLSVGLSLITWFLPTDWLTAGTNVPHWCFSLGVLAIGLQVVPIGAMNGLERYGSSAAVSIFVGILAVLTAFYAAYLGSVTLAIVSIAGVAMLQAIGQSFIVVKIVGIRRIFKYSPPSWAVIRAIFNFAGPMLLVSILAASGPWILGRILLMQADGDREFAILSIGMQWYALTLVLPGVFARVMLPRLIREESGDSDYARNLSLKILKLSLGTAVPIAILGGILSPYIVKIYGPQYSSLTPLLLIFFLVAAVVNVPSNILGTLMVAKGKALTWLSLTFIWLFVLLAVGHLLAKFGALSAAISLGGAAIIQAALTFYVSKKLRLFDSNVKLADEKS